MKRMLVLGVQVGVGTLSIAVAGQAPPSGPTPKSLQVTKIEKVKDNLYIVTGSGAEDTDAFSGGNTAVFVTNDGVTLVDTKLRGWGPTILQHVRSVTNKPVTRIINTHAHGDHTGSNPQLAGPNPMFPTTVSHGNSAYSWNTTPRSGPGAITARPSSVTPPLDADSNPATMLSSVDLPQPLGPTMVRNSPTATSRSIAPSACTGSPRADSKRLDTPAMTIFARAASTADGARASTLRARAGSRGMLTPAGIPVATAAASARDGG